MTFRPLSKALQKVAETELNEVPHRVQDDLNHIREWLATKPRLNARKGDQWLLNYLRSCKFDLERTKCKIELYHTNKMNTPEFFTNRDPLLPEIQEILRRGILVILPKTTPAGPKTIIIRIIRADLVLDLVPHFLKLIIMVLEILHLENDNAVVSGVCFLVDGEGWCAKHITLITPNLIRKMIVCAFRTFPMRFKGSFFMNIPSSFKIVFNLLRFFFPAKLKNRLQLCSDLDDVGKLIPKSILPKEYGGEGPSCDEIAEQWKLKMESYRDWFLEDTSKMKTLHNQRKLNK